MTVARVVRRSAVASLCFSLAACLPPPQIAIDHTPRCGTTNDLLRGHTQFIDATKYRVVAYVRVPYSGPGGRLLWWGAKPYYGVATAIAGDGKFSVDVDTGGNDEDATEIAVFVVAASFRPPNTVGGAALPTELTAASLVEVRVPRCPAP